MSGKAARDPLGMTTGHFINVGGGLPKASLR